ncbi:MAG: hypothetical protein ACI89L_002561 [Phycisphaerales bacterium]|jgi:uncharacterized protein (DUF885 family)
MPTKPSVARSYAPAALGFALAGLVSLPNATLAAAHGAYPTEAFPAGAFPTQAISQTAPPAWQVFCPEGRDAVLWAFMDQYVTGLHRLSPGIGDTLGDDSLNHRLGDSSAAASEASDDWAKQQRATLASIDRSGFSPADHLDADLLLYQLDQWINAIPLMRWQMPVSSMNGPQVWLPQMGRSTPLTKDRHYTDYVAKLGQVETRLTDAMTNMRLGIEQGRVPPRVTLTPTVEQAMAQATPSIREDPTTSPFFSPLNGLPEGDPRRDEAAAIIELKIVPAYLELALFLQNEYIPEARESVGIAQGIDGVEAYSIALRQHTTLDLTADQVHETGLSEVARIKSEMMEVIARTDWDSNKREWTDDDALFAAFIHYLRTDPRFYYESAGELLTGYRNICKLIDAEMPRLFGVLPRLPYGVRPLPTFAAKSAPTAFYYPGSAAGGVPGYFMANVYDLPSRPKYDMIALTLHEAVPGHHHQIALSQEMEGRHTMRKLAGFTAFSEGWALYAERLGLEVGQDNVDDGVDRGLYANPYDDFGRLNFEMWRALRLVVDTGIHTKGWTRTQAIDYMLANSALTQVNANNEVDRYIGWPGQATAYKIGQLKISELRAKAETALGDAFDLRAFHDTVLENGAIPLPVLEAQIDRWIAEQGD